MSYQLQLPEVHLTQRNLIPQFKEECNNRLKSCGLRLGLPASPLIGVYRHNQKWCHVVLKFTCTTPPRSWTTRGQQKQDFQWVWSYYCKQHLRFAETWLYNLPVHLLHFQILHHKQKHKKSEVARTLKVHFTQPRITESELLLHVEAKDYAVYKSVHLWLPGHFWMNSVLTET